MVLEAQQIGLSGIVIWGCHRDTKEIVEIGFPVFSYGSCSLGPFRLDVREPHALSRVRFGNFEVTKKNLVFGDIDGVIFVEREHADEILATARELKRTEHKQTDDIRGGPFTISI